MSTYAALLKEGEGRLLDAGIEEGRLDAWYLFSDCFSMDKGAYFLRMNEEASCGGAVSRFESLIEGRCRRIPLQQLLGNQEFMGLSFAVNEHVLIPRQDTELLVLEAEKQLRKTSDASWRVLDMCTGSGCIAISLKTRNPQIRCVAVDLSEQALEVAEKNAEKMQAEIQFVHTDMFSNITGTFDMIVSNPPYIPTKVIESLEEEVRLYDPFSALDGKEDGLYFYRILAKESPRFLKNGGWLYMEIGHDQSAAVEKLLKDAGFEEIRTEKDLAGLDRVVCGVYNRSEEDE